LKIYDIRVHNTDNIKSIYQMSGESESMYTHTSTVACHYHRDSDDQRGGIPHYDVKDRHQEDVNGSFEILNNRILKESKNGDGHETYIYVQYCICGNIYFPGGLFRLMIIKSINDESSRSYRELCGCTADLSNCRWFFASEEEERGLRFIGNY